MAMEPVPPEVLAGLVDASVAEVDACLEDLVARYDAEHHGFVLAHVAGGYRYQTAPDLAEHVERFLNRGVSARLSTAALETLAIVAYRQPVSRAQIAALRGVAVDGVTRLLEQRGYIEVVGRAEGPGQPSLYGTTARFLERLGLGSLSDLPPVEQLLPDAETARQIEDALASGAGAGPGGAGPGAAADGT